MKNNLIITIEREFGSGGHVIGEKLAEALGVPFYDEAIIERAAMKSGFDKEFIEEQEQKINNSLLFNIATNGYYTGGSLHDQIFIAERDTLIEVAQQGACVIVGRCADYILREGYNCLNVFVHAEKEDRIKRVVEEYGVKGNNISSIIDKTDKQRARHYQYYSDQVWGASENYHLTLNTSRFSIEQAVGILKDVAELF
ncbi:MAG: cytidylate kinase-like family protein [Oscillospiraceae bacterium]|nr:cytidylate kinase-like family protein [Oscillospiraceae bacterium]